MNGVITTMVAYSTYETTHQYGADDNGFTNVRRVSMDHTKMFRGESFANSWPRLNYYYNEVVPYPARNLDYGIPSMFTNLEVGTWTPYEQVKWAIGVYDSGKLNGSLTNEERNPTLISRSLLGDLDEQYVIPAYNAGFTSVINNDGDSAATFTITGSSYEDVYKKFNELAMNRKNDIFGYNIDFGGRFNPEIYYFGDGLALVPPTQELVDEMLAGTTRNRDEVLGKLKMRGGIITVEKVAINAVMAGAKPEYFPVILAAMEAYANGFDNGKMYYHAMSTGGLYGFSLLVSGPIAEELGMNSETGYMGAGNDANNTIGRAVRMCIRNIGHNKTPNIDTTGRVGKQNDHTLTVLVENAAALPDGWKTHSEMMGFPAGSSTISLLEYGSNFTMRKVASEPEAWTTAEVLRDLRRNHQGSNVGFVVFPPAVADTLSEQGLTSKELVKEWFAGSADAYALIPNPGNSGSNKDRAVIWPVVAGADPGKSIVFSANMGARDTYQTQLITGATLTEAGNGPTAPGTPRNFEVTYNFDRTEATLTWAAPASNGGSPVIGYQVTKDDGGNSFRPTGTGYMATANNQGINWEGALPRAATAPPIYRNYLGNDVFEYTFTDLDPSAQYFFRVRAINGVRTSAEVVGLANIIGGYTPDDFNLRAAGTGAWAMITPPTSLIAESP